MVITWEIPISENDGTVHWGLLMWLKYVFSELKELYDPHRSPP